MLSAPIEHSTSLIEPLTAYAKAITSRIGAETNRDPWTRLSDSERIDHLPPLIDALLELALCESANPDVNLTLLRSAFAHGEHHRTQGFDEEQILDEYYILRDQAYRALSQDVGFNEALDIITRVDPAVTRATVASLCGTHGRTMASARALRGHHPTG